MQSNSHEDANKREQTPQSVSGMSHQSAFEMEEGQVDQWAVLRHEAEEEYINRHQEPVQSDWKQREIEDDDRNRASTSQAYYQSPFLEELTPNHIDIVVAGIGGAGMNAVNRMINTRVRGVRFVALNTDIQVLSRSEASDRICLGQQYTKGLGAGGNAAAGKRAALESTEDIRNILGDADLVFIAAGMGGGTGTGGAPVVASIAKKLGMLTIGIVTLPFTFEGSRRQRIAEEGLKVMSAESDALIIVPNDRLLSLTGRDHSLTDAFKLADDVLRQGVQGIAEVINVPGLINVDFADVRSVLRDAGTALMSIGQGQGHNRAQRAAEEAIAGGFLNMPIRGAQRVLFNISGGEDMTLYEVNEVAEFIGTAIDATADITFGAVIDPRLDDTIRVTLIAAGMQDSHAKRIPVMQVEQADLTSSMSLPAKQHETPDSPSRNADNFQQPLAKAPFTPAQNMPAEKTEAGFLPPPRQSTTLARPHRSLDDLRGLRSMGRRHEVSPVPQIGLEEENILDNEEIDVPPFLKKYT
ncbi:MAG TPA: cell division protein FtsZ [Ktedonobacteraceae bacterium]|nr:cell division protein FtsZ [Ktedonobacteraceae bacterium]